MMEKINQQGKRTRLGDAPVNISAPDGIVVDLDLLVTTPGQTEFNIFEMPDPEDTHELLINGLTYFEGSYSLGTSGPNTILIWGNLFPLGITDEIKFRKFK